MTNPLIDQKTDRKITKVLYKHLSELAADNKFPEPLPKKRMLNPERMLFITPPYLMVTEGMDFNEAVRATVRAVWKGAGTDDEVYRAMTTFDAMLTFYVVAEQIEPVVEAVRAAL